MLTRTIQIGTHRDLDSIRESLRGGNNIMIGAWAYEIFFKVPLSPSPKSLNLGFVTVGELGFHGGAKWSNILKAAQNSSSLSLCPPEVGLQLRLQYLNQPIGEKLFVAMKPIVSDGGYPMIFELSNSNSGLLINCEIASSEGNYSDGQWDKNAKFVFSLSK